MSTKTANKYTAEPRDYTKSEWLYEQYWEKGLSLAEVADASEHDISTCPIRVNMEKHGIDRRPPTGHRHAGETPDDDPIDLFNIDHHGEEESIEIDWENES